MADVSHFLSSWQNWLLLVAVPVLVGLLIGLGKKLAEAFATGIGKVLGEAAGNWLKENLLPGFVPYRRRYLEHLYYRHRDFDVKGFAEEGPYTLELKHVFVQLSLDSKALIELNANPLRKLPPELATGRHYIWEYLADNDQKLAIIGAPGSGKTTLLQHMALAACAGRKSGVGSPAVKCIPAVLSLRKHAKVVADKPALPLADAIREELGPVGAQAPRNWFESRLEEGRCLVLMDGLDEVADSALRAKVVEWVEGQMKVYPRNRFVVTSRPNGYRANPLSGVNVLEVRPFVPDQVRDFVQNWYLANELKSRGGKDDAGVRMKSREGADGLLNKLHTSADLSDLAVNPLLLTMIATVHRYRGSLPASRVELYGEICTVFLGRRRHALGLDFDLRPDQRQSVIEPLAYHLMHGRKREIAADEAASGIGKPLAEVRPNLSPADFLREICNSGLLMERESGVYAFSHLTFQEYLAAVYLRNTGNANELATRIHDPWWHETIRLYVAQSDATTIVQACLGAEAPSVESLVLAIQCIEEAKKVDPQMRLQFEERIARATESETAEERKPVCEALLRLRLSRATPLDENRFLSGYITNVEYQLFLDELRARGEYRQPDHWPDYRFPRGQGSEPVAGVRASDAATFAEWLSERSGDGWRCRLLTAYEAVGASRASKLHDDVGLGFWVDAAGAGFQIAGVSDNVRAQVAQGLRAFTPEPVFGHLGFASALDLDLDLNRDLDRAFDPNPDLVRALDRDRDLDLARDRARDLDRDLDRDLTRAVDLAVDLDLDRDLARVLDLDRDLARARDRDRDRALDLARVLDLARALDRDLDRAAHLVGDRNRGHLYSLLGPDRMAEGLRFLPAYCAWVSVIAANQVRIALILLQRARIPEKSPKVIGLERLRDSYLNPALTFCLLKGFVEGQIQPFGGIRVIKERSTVTPVNPPSQ